MGTLFDVKHCSSHWEYKPYPHLFKVLHVNEETHGSNTYTHNHLITTALSVQKGKHREQEGRCSQRSDIWPGAENSSKNRDAFQAEATALGETPGKKEWRNLGTGKNVGQSSSVKMPEPAAGKELIYPGTEQTPRR